MKKYVFVGGGTMGSVSPLIAIYEELLKRDPNTQALWIGTEDGPERVVVEAAGLRFESIPTGKLRRYFSLQNFIDPFKVLLSIFKAKKLLKEFQPDLVLTAGSHVCVPVSKAAKSLKIPYFIHQQDIKKGLANQIMEKDAAVVTITYDQSINDFDYKKTQFTSNPVRKAAFECEAQDAITKFNLSQDRKTILIMGGGIGAVAINQLTLESLGILTQEYQVVHITGKGKSIENLIGDWYTREEQLRIRQHYKSFEFITEGMCELLREAEVVVTRAGISSLTELSYLGKPSIIIPIPDSHQEDNAVYYKKYNAAVVLDQQQLTGERFAKSILDLLGNRATKESLHKNISQMIEKDGASRYATLIEKFLR